MSAYFKKIYQVQFAFNIDAFKLIHPSHYPENLVSGMSRASSARAGGIEDPLHP